MNPPNNPIDIQNRQKKRNFHHQVGLQIFLPLFICIIVFIILVVIVTVTSMGSVPTGTRLANISAIFLIIPLLAFGIIALTLIIGINILLGRIPHYLTNIFTLGGVYFFRIEIFISKLSKFLVEPIYRIIIFRSTVLNYLKKIQK